ncbi:tRNA pseudouridine(38-40) synthase TruA [Sulfurospirillum barnesii]|uniref:tRNA pseudouridine synthase A n=1 Tax=Sulfurospirillum barnesii (strain ATCC 700032 / DSM 10660 / SES-3) TaxID=760154 RepID=I3XWV5_SULBS|nr:tRNA pseudouridine(38-40) synthase TruA [Sulfurospirillum barnesii]AFL68429.1 pseudouridylate synthase I [Sulfurospirillum barnesii SES-3]
MRLKITLSYDGSAFYGFQHQKNENTAFKTVAGSLEQSLKHLNIHTQVVGSGRTDRGVHALAQVIHLDVPPLWQTQLEKLQYLLNRTLLPHIHIKHISPVTQDFHARFSAKKRLYRYVLYDGMCQPFYANYALHVKPLDVQKLHTLAQVFTGFHNFEFFKKQGGGTTKNERTLFRTGAYRYKNFIVLYFFGDAFLRSQIRMMSDFLLKVCYKERRLEDLVAQINREKRISTALLPPQGLYLSRIYY